MAENNHIGIETEAFKSQKQALAAALTEMSDILTTYIIYI